MTRAMALLCALAVATASRAEWNPDTGTITNERWASGLPLGGLGCGKIELFTDGAFGNATIHHNWQWPIEHLKGAFLAVASDGLGRLLRRPADGEYANVENIAVVRATMQFPRATLRFEDEALPVKVELRAFSPLVARDIEDSSLPLALFQVGLENRGGRPREVAVAMAWPNLLGLGAWTGEEYQLADGRGVQPGQRGLRYVHGSAARPADPRSNALGEYYLAVGGDDPVRMVTGWEPDAAELSWWDAFVSGAEPPRDRGTSGAVIATVRLAPSERRVVTFALAWRLPHHLTRQRLEVPTDRYFTTQQGVAAAFDRDPRTRWTTGRPMLPGDALAIRLKHAAKVAAVDLDFAASLTDYPRGLDLRVTPDGGPWVPVATRSARELDMAAGRATVAFDPVDATAVLVVQTGQDPYWWWSVHEVRVRDAAGAEVPIAAVEASLRIVEPQDRIEDVGHYYLRRFDDVRSIAEYGLANRERLARGTAAWQDMIAAATLPAWLKRKLVNDLSVLFSNTVLTRDGRYSILASPLDEQGALGAMSQRLAAQAGVAALFPELDRRELTLFADCQLPDGRIPDLCGDVYGTIGGSGVPNGAPDWPDLACSFVMQVHQAWRSSGDEEFRRRLWPAVKEAMAWLAAADTDGDGVPEGGSAFDEGLSRGAFCYSAGGAIGAWRAAAELARAAGESQTVTDYRSRALAALIGMSTALWNGQYYRKLRTSTGETDEDSYALQLAGDWMSRSSGLGPCLDPTQARIAVKHVLARHQRPFYPIPAMEVTPEGRPAAAASALLSLQPFVGCEAIYQGFVDDGLETLRRVYETVWELYRSPWDQALAYAAPRGQERYWRSHMAALASWNVLPALSGASLDVPGRRLCLAPRLLSRQSSSRLPLFFPRFWAWLEYAPSEDRLRVRVTRCFGEPVEIARVDGVPGSDPVVLERAVAMREGAVLDLGPYHRRLQPDPVSRDVGFTVSRPVERARGHEPEGWRARVRGEGLGPPARIDAPLAFDGDRETRWTTGREMRTGDTFQLDLGRELTFARIELDAGPSRRDFPRGLAVEVSSDGRRWRALTGVNVLTGDDGSVRATFAPVSARHLRLVNQGVARGLWWSIHELYIWPE